MTTTDETYLTPTQQRARDDARRLLDQGAVILDTETTGLDTTARLVEIAILAADGAVLLDSLVNPDMPIPPDATAVHGISDADVAGALTLPDLWPLICDTIADRPVICWNSPYDHKIIHQHAAIYGLVTIGAPFHCAMRLWSAHQGLWRWQRLDQAAYSCKVPLDGAHRARQDCMATVGVLRWMAGLPALREQG